jgi:serine/threonine protein kinase
VRLATANPPTPGNCRNFNPDALTYGTRIGAYEIRSPLAAGGMGEVYRSTDTKLDRDVALKVLPDAVARDAEWLARFEHEARIAATLNHPNIVTLYSIEDIEGVRFLTMELVDRTP